MNLPKTELQMLTAEQIGRELEGIQEKLTRKIYQHQGASSVLKEVEKLVDKSTQQVRDEIIHSEGEDLPYDPHNEIEVGKYIVSKMMKLSKDIHHMAEGASISCFRAEGQQKGMELAIKQVFNFFNTQKSRFDLVKKSLEEGTMKVEGDDVVLEDNFEGPRPAGFHPGPPLKAVRQSEKEEEEPEEPEES